jgi:multiple sugar transport system permease protein
MSSTTQVRGSAGRTTSAGPSGPKLRRRRSVGHRLTPYYFLLPSMVIIGIFVVYPMLHALFVSFTDSSIIGSFNFVGIANYQKLVSDPVVLNALGNTLLYALVTVPISVVLALFFAVLLNRKFLPGRTFFRAVIFFPFVISFAIISIAWAFMLDPQVGIIISWLNALGIPTGNGIRDPNLAMPAVMLVGIWRNIGFFMVMFLAGLQSVPRELQEAAEIDGATPWQRFRLVTLPLLANTSMFVLIIATIFSFQAFDHIFVLTNGGPYFRTESLVMLIYRTGFVDYQFGYASAISWLLVALVLGISLIQMWYFRNRTVRY